MWAGYQGMTWNPAFASTGRVLGMRDGLGRVIFLRTASFRAADGETADGIQHGAARTCCIPNVVSRPSGTGFPLRYQVARLMPSASHGRVRLSCPPSSRDGHTGSADRTTVTMAERMCGEAHRIDPAGLP